MYCPAVLDRSLMMLRNDYMFFWNLWLVREAVERIIKSKMVEFVCTLVGIRKISRGRYGGGCEVKLQWYNASMIVQVVHREITNFTLS